jgi:hypothetical protein
LREPPYPVLLKYARLARVSTDVLIDDKINLPKDNSCPTEHLMPITTWIRDLLGIPKDVIDLKKSKLELERLEHEKQERDLVSRATLEDVKKYDPKYKLLNDKIEESEKRPDFHIPATDPIGPGWRELLLLLLMLAMLIYLIYFLIYIFYEAATQ